MFKHRVRLPAQQGVGAGGGGRAKKEQPLERSIWEEDEVDPNADEGEVGAVITARREPSAAIPASSSSAAGLPGSHAAGAFARGPDGLV